MAESSQAAPPASQNDDDAKDLKCYDAYFDPNVESLPIFGDDLDLDCKVSDHHQACGGLETKVEEMDISRDPGFYEAPDVVKISSKLATRLFYDQDRCSFMVFFRKLNDLKLTPEHSYFAVTPDSIKSLWQAIQLACDELEITEFDKIPKSQEGEAGKILDKDSPDYWSIANWTTNKQLAVRSYKSDSGSYLIRVMMKRPPSPQQRFPKWIGRSMSLKVTEARAFIRALKDFEGMVKEADRVRVEVAKIRQQQERKLEGCKSTFENISP